MISIPVIITMLFFAVPENHAVSIDYIVTLQYHTSPFGTRQWSISVLREGNETYIHIEGFMGKRVKKGFPVKEYRALLNNLNRKGIWRLKDFYNGNSGLSFYKVIVKKGKYSNIFRIEKGVMMNTGRTEYREIIRTIMNTAKLSLMD